MVARRVVPVLAAALAELGCASSPEPPRPLPPRSPPPALAELPAEEQVTLSGRVGHVKTGEPIAGALVIAQCQCLAGQYEVRTDAAGLHAFRGLPAGKYTVQVLHDQANISKSMDLPAGATFRANYPIDPKPSRSGCCHCSPGVNIAEKSLLHDRCTARPGQTPECRQELTGLVHATSVR